MKYIVEESSISAIADAIRTRKKTDSPMSLADMATAVYTIGSENLIDVATTTVTFDSDFSGTAPVDSEFVRAICNDYSTLNGYPQAYMYSVVAAGAEELQNGFFASSEQFFVNSASSEEISITFGSSYHKWWTLTNGNISMKEANGSGFVVGGSAGVNTTINTSAGIWAASGASVKAGSYRVSVFRLGMQ